MATNYNTSPLARHFENDSAFSTTLRFRLVVMLAVTVVVVVVVVVVCRQSTKTLLIRVKEFRMSNRASRNLGRKQHRASEIKAETQLVPNKFWER